MKKKNSLSAITIIGAALLVINCKKDSLPDNPYDKVDYSTNVTASDTSDKYSLTGIHKDIIFPKCATPGCHDGNFEPDFRSVMSTYSTLVYHKILKNNNDSDFTFRVVPFKSAESVLYERISNCCFVNTNDRMPQSDIGTALPDEDIARIKKWIDDGAKDFEGNISVFPNTEPNFQWFWLVSAPNWPSPPYDVLSEEGDRLDDVSTNPLVLDTGLTAYLTLDVVDDSTAHADIKNGTLWFSYHFDDFSNPVKSVTAEYLPYDDGAWFAKFKTNELPLDTTLFMRYSANDGDHVEDTYNPNNSSPFWFKGIWSVIVKKGGKK